MIVLTNIGESGVGGLIAAGVAKLYIPSMSVRAMKTVVDAEPDRTQKVQKALVARLANKPDGTLMTAQLIQSLSTLHAKDANERIATFGMAKKLDLVVVEKVNGKDYFLYRADTGRRLFLWRVAFTADGMISEMVLEEEE